MPLFWVWIVSAHREEFRSCDKITDVRLAPLAVSKWMHPKILVSQLVRTFCGAHPSPIFPLILFSGWFVFAVCLAGDFKSAWATHPKTGIQSSSQTLLLIAQKKKKSAVDVLFVNNLLSQVRLNRTLDGQVKVRLKTTVILLLERFSK